MGRLFWIIHMGPKCNHINPNKREAEGDFTHTRTRTHTHTYYSSGKIQLRKWLHEQNDFSECPSISRSGCVEEEWVHLWVGAPDSAMEPWSGRSSPLL